MKKFVLALLAVVLVLGLSSVAFAACTDSTTHEAGKQEWKVVEAATCEKDALWQLYCNACKKFVNDTKLTGPQVSDGAQFNAPEVLKGHRYGGDWKTQAPTCTEKGYEYKDCLRCGKIEARLTQNEVKALGHGEVYTDNDNVLSTDCTLSGTINQVCSVCKQIVASEEIPGGKHNWVITEEVVKGDCTTGYVHNVRCTKCGKTSVDKGTAGTHEYKLVKITGETCTQDGIVSFKCQKCGDVQAFVKSGVIFKKDSVKSIENGIITKFVAVGDGEAYFNETAANHTYNNGATAWADVAATDTNSKAATCLKDGFKTQKCGICGELKQVPVKTAGHKWTAWTVVAEPRCTTDGLKVRYCTNPACDAEVAPGDKVMESVVIPALGHNVKVADKVVAATCTTAGSESGRCIVCNETVTKTIDALGHAYGEWTIKDGLKYKVCANCNDIVVETVAPVVPETPADPEDKPSSGNGGSSNTGNGGSSSTGSGSDASIPATGDNTSNAPYIMMVAAVAGLVVLVASKRKVNC